MTEISLTGKGRTLIQKRIAQKTAEHFDGEDTLTKGGYDILVRMAIAELMKEHPNGIRDALLD